LLTDPPRRSVVDAAIAITGGVSLVGLLVASASLAVGFDPLASLLGESAAESGMWMARLSTVLAVTGTGAMGWFLLGRRSERMAAERIAAAARAWAGGERDASALICSGESQASVAAWNRIVAALGERSEPRADRRRGDAGPSGGAERRLVPMCNALPDGLLLVGDDGRVRYANGAAGFLFGRSSEQLLNVPAQELFETPEVLAAIRDATGGVSRIGPPVDVPRGEQPADGVVRYVVRPIKNDGSRDAVILVQDVTQQHVAAAAREAFVAHVAHELRTPLTNILLWAQTAAERGADDPRMTERAITVITDESRRLERVVQDMLSISEIESGRQNLTLTDVDLLVLADDLRNDFGPQARKKGVELHFELPPKLPVLTADRDKIGVALHNLVGNAIKYTPAGGSVKVQLRESDEGQVVFEVEDTGIGIKEADLSRIFERFQRAQDERIAKITGSGLGLAIARDLARLHGGDIEAESQPDEGSRFTLRLPVRRAA
jgi:two-component system phosphate regulon sensor histidine kinase PhoR